MSDDQTKPKGTKVKHDISLYQLTDEEKNDLISRLTQDVTFTDEESQFETEYEIDLENDSFLDEVL